MLDCEFERSTFLVGKLECRCRRGFAARQTPELILERLDVGRFEQPNSRPGIPERGDDRLSPAELELERSSILGGFVTAGEHDHLRRAERECTQHEIRPERTDVHDFERDYV